MGGNNLDAEIKRIINEIDKDYDNLFKLLNVKCFSDENCIFYHYSMSVIPFDAIYIMPRETREYDLLLSQLEVKKDNNSYKLSKKSEYFDILLIEDISQEDEYIKRIWDIYLLTYPVWFAGNRNKNEVLDIKMGWFNIFYNIELKKDYNSKIVINHDFFNELLKNNRIGKLSKIAYRSILQTLLSSIMLEETARKRIASDIIYLSENIEQYIKNCGNNDDTQFFINKKSIAYSLIQIKVLGGILANKPVEIKQELIDKILKLGQHIPQRKYKSTQSANLTTVLVIYFQNIENKEFNEKMAESFTKLIAKYKPKILFIVANPININKLTFLHEKIVKYLYNQCKNDGTYKCHILYIFDDYLGNGINKFIEIMAKKHGILCKNKIKPMIGKELIPYFEFIILGSNLSIKDIKNRISKNLQQNNCPKILYDIGNNIVKDIKISVLNRHKNNSCIILDKIEEKLGNSSGSGSDIELHVIVFGDYSKSLLTGQIKNLYECIYKDAKKRTIVLSKMLLTIIPQSYIIPRISRHGGESFLMMNSRNDWCESILDSSVSDAYLEHIICTYTFD